MLVTAIVGERSYVAVSGFAGNFAIDAELFDEHHPYDLPELVALEVEDGSSAYLNWLRAGTDRPEG